MIGLTYYSYAPFVKAGLPVQPLPTPKEGVYVSGGSGHLVVLKNAPHPNATKDFHQLVSEPRRSGSLHAVNAPGVRAAWMSMGSGFGSSASYRQRIA